MRRSRVASALVLLTGLAAGLAACSSDHPQELRVEKAWARTTPAGATTGVVYLSITSPRDDELTDVGVDEDVARSAELHATMTSGGSGMANMPGMDHGDESGAMHMTPLDAVRLPAGKAVRFSPGAMHVMLVSLRTQLVAGDDFSITLHFAHHDDVTASVVVADNPPD